MDRGEGAFAIAAVKGGAKERPTLEVDPATAPVVRELFEKSLRGSGLKELCKELNDRGITNRGKRWYKGTLHYVLRNEAYTGTAVWGKTSKGQDVKGGTKMYPGLIATCQSTSDSRFSNRLATP